MTIGIIPARAGSKRLPGKNIKPFGGQPLVLHIVQTALQAHSIDRVYVTTDDDDIIALVTDLEDVVAIRRPERLADDESPAIDYIHHLFGQIDDIDQVEYAVILQPTSPLTLPGDIDAAVDMLKAREVDTVVSMVEVEHMLNPLKLKVMDGDTVKPYLEEENGRMAHHELPNVYVRNCAIYASKKSVYTGGQVIGTDCLGYVMPRERSVDINDGLDFDFAEFLYRRSAADVDTSSSSVRE